MSLTMDTEASVVPAIELRNNSCCWSVSVAAAETRKAEDASKGTRRTSRPPSFTGKLAWNHWISVRSRLQMVPMSNIARRGWLTHGEQRSVCSIFGALNDIFSRMSVSCAVYYYYCYYCCCCRCCRFVVVVIVIFIVVVVVFVIHYRPTVDSDHSLCKLSAMGHLSKPTQPPIHPWWVMTSNLCIYIDFGCGGRDH